MESKFSIGVLVANHYGVLNRVAGLYAKRGYNIDSLAVGVTQDPELSRITIVSTGDDYTREQIVKQLQKLHDVKKVVLLEFDASVGVEHMLIKLKVDNNKLTIIKLINSYSGKVMDFGDTFITAEITGDSKKIDDFIALSRKVGIIELSRSGLIALSHSDQNTL